MLLPETLQVPTDQPWFNVRRAEPGIHIIEESYQVEQVKSYLVEGRERAVLIDTGCGVGDLRRLVEGLTSLPVIVVNSHAHWDHIGGNHQFEEIWIHEAEADKLEEGVPNAKLRPAFQPDQLTGPLPEGVDPDTLAFPPTKATRRLADGDLIRLGERTLEVIYGPGHSPGGISLLDEANGVLFSTDVAYIGPLYVDSPDLLPTYHRSLSRLADLAPRLNAVYPSHGDSPISPSKLAEMRDLIASIIAGRKPESQVEDMASYRTGEVGAYVWGTPQPA
jgi:glyoxylase-like metal-dependent hydrolase (beta-lactamase superfamily II)